MCMLNTVWHSLRGHPDLSFEISEVPRDPNYQLRRNTSNDLTGETHSSSNFKISQVKILALSSMEFYSIDKATCENYQNKSILQRQIKQYQAGFST